MIIDVHLSLRTVFRTSGKPGCVWRIDDKHLGQGLFRLNSEPLIVFVPLLAFNIGFDRCSIDRAHRRAEVAAHMCWPQYRLRHSGSSACMRRLDRPLMYCTIFASERIAWGIGRKKEDDGAMLLLSVADR